MTESNPFSPPDMESDLPDVERPTASVRTEIVKGFYHGMKWGALSLLMALVPIVAIVAIVFLLVPVAPDDEEIRKELLDFNITNVSMFLIGLFVAVALFGGFSAAMVMGTTAFLRKLTVSSSSTSGERP